MSEKTLQDFIKEVMDKKHPKGWLGVDKEDIIDAAILYATYRAEQAKAEAFEEGCKAQLWFDTSQMMLDCGEERGIKSEVMVTDDLGEEYGITPTLQGAKLASNPYKTDNNENDC